MGEGQISSQEAAGTEEQPRLAPDPGGKRQRRVQVRWTLLALEPAQSWQGWEWEAESRVLHKVPRPAATGEGLSLGEQPPGPSLPIMSPGKATLSPAPADPRLFPGMQSPPA